jgi:hypothetical protein
MIKIEPAPSSPFKGSKYLCMNANFDGLTLLFYHFRDKNIDYLNIIKIMKSKKKITRLEITRRCIIVTSYDSDERE